MKNNYVKKIEGNNPLKVADSSSVGFSNDQVKGLSTEFNLAFAKWEKKRGIKEKNFNQRKYK
jgi:hypothetical protein